MTSNLLSYLSRAHVEIKLLVGAKSLFSGYSKALEKANPDADDIVILCHDDIEILVSQDQFLSCLLQAQTPGTGFIGVAGTKYLAQDAVWWNQDQWRKGSHRGLVLHGKNAQTADWTWYGPAGEVAICDGLFLAAKASVLRDIGLSKPDYLTGNWDFYDIHYTHSAWKKGYKNKVVPLFVMHNSSGYGVLHDSWKQNRDAFVKHHSWPISVWN